MKRYAITYIAGCSVAWVACGSNPFAPEIHTPTEAIVIPPAPPADRPEILMDNLNKAMNERDKDLYETLIDDRFWFTETDCAGELVWFNGKEEELEFIGGSRDGSQPGLFDIYRNFEFEFELISRSVELGAEYPKAHEDDPDGHPDEDWEVFRGRVKDAHGRRKPGRLPGRSNHDLQTARGPSNWCLPTALMSMALQPPRNPCGRSPAGSTTRSPATAARPMQAMPNE